MPISTIGSSSLNQTSDLTINGQTVGKGGGNVATNTVHGVSALASGSQTGVFITAVGENALNANTSGNVNDAFGKNALKANTTGGYNKAFGAFVLEKNTTGSNNVGVGDGALNNNTTASNNTAVGYQAAYTNSTGPNGTFVGYQAGYSNTTGNAHTLVGYQAGYGITTGTDNTFIGNGSGNAGTATTTGSANTYIGSACRGSAVGNNREIVIGFNIAGTGTNTVSLGADTGKVYNSFSVNATWTQASDGRMKTNIKDDSLGLSFINRLRPVTFTWKPSNELEQDNPYYAEENKRDTTTVIHGLIAQEVKSALDAEGVDTFAGWDMGADGVQAISREMFVSPLIKAIQELKAINDQQAETINALTARIVALEAK